MINTIIFDFDGLIVDTESIWYQAYYDIILANHGKELSIEQFSRCIGTHNVLDEVLRELLGDGIDLKELDKQTYEQYKSLLTEPVLREGVIEYLEEAKARGLTIALASSSSRDWIESYLKKLGIYSYFSVINTRDDVTNVKPDPELYVKTLEDCQINADEAIIFEDSLNGLKAAVGAGVHCVVVPNPVTAHLPFEGHRLRISSMSDKSLGEILQEV